MATVKLTKAALLERMDEKLQRLNLLKSALQGESHIKQAELENYKKQFEELFAPKGKK